MDFEQYMRDGVMPFMCEQRDVRDRLANGALGISGEAGEVTDIVKKILYHPGHTLEGERDKLVLEIGDVLWYAGLLCVSLDIPLEEAARRNVEKLRARWPNGFGKPVRTAGNEG